MGTHGRQARILGPKSENNRNAERSEESAGKDYRDKEGKKGKRRKTILSVPNAGDLERSTVVERG